jgi:hypothetical protein
MGDRFSSQWIDDVINNLKAMVKATYIGDMTMIGIYDDIWAGENPTIDGSVMVWILDPIYLRCKCVR